MGRKDSSHRYADVQPTILNPGRPTGACGGCMGFDVQGIRFLLGAQRSGVSFARTATIGRQEFFIHPKDLRKIFEAFGVPDSEVQARRLLTEAKGFTEPLLQWLGAEHIVSIDASAYEGASIVHDMNLPVPDSLRGCFSVVIDAGTLEHVFNYPVALKNCMEMVEDGGSLLLVTPANNFMGHGFYQFSPELFFRTCSAPNGFELLKVIVCEVDPDAPWYRVVDPAKARRRVELVTTRPAYLLVHARRVRQVPVFAAAPQQSDYTALWQEGSGYKNLPDRGRPALPLRLLRGVARRLAMIYRLIEPAALGARRIRPDSSVFTKVSWRPDSPESIDGRS